MTDALLVVEQIMRPRWPELYAARKRRLEPHILLPEMPNTFLGWIPKLYKVSEEQILATAGLDAFVVGASRVHGSCVA